MNSQPHTERDLIVEVVNRVGYCVDTGDWDTLRACFADTLRADYTSLTGGEPTDVRADDLIAGWRQVITALHGMQHLIGGHLVNVEGDRAECRAQVQATHVYDDGDPATENRWVCAGHYCYTLARLNDLWQINGATFTLVWEAGDRKVIERATGS